MEYLKKRKLFTDKIVLDCDQILRDTPSTITKEKALEIDSILIEKFRLEIEKIENGTSTLISKK